MHEQQRPRFSQMLTNSRRTTEFMERGLGRNNNIGFLGIVGRVSDVVELGPGQRIIGIGSLDLILLGQLQSTPRFKATLPCLENKLPILFRISLRLIHFCGYSRHFVWSNMTNQICGLESASRRSLLRPGAMCPMFPKITRRPPAAP